jgi:hypothetical protein
MTYYHIVFSSPLGFNTFFYRGKEHPLMPEVYLERTKKLATQISLKSGQIIPDEAIAYISIHELPIEVAKARWPEDFKDANL